MSTDKALLREWMDVLALGPAEAWQGRVADDVIVRLPFAPPGIAAEMRGIEQAIAMMASHWESKERFDWCDVVIRATEDPGLFVITARSDVLFRSGLRYANDYIVLTRLRGGLVVEHTEYFNPLPVLEMLKTA